MKFVNYLERITGVTIYPLISLALFFVLFIALAVWAFKVRAPYINMMKELPLEDGTEHNNNDTDNP